MNCYHPGANSSATLNRIIDCTIQLLLKSSNQDECIKMKTILHLLLCIYLVNSSCIENPSCFCDQLSTYNLDYHLACPTLRQKIIDVEVQRNRRVRIICNQGPSHEDLWAEVQKLQLKNIKRIELQGIGSLKETRIFIYRCDSISRIEVSE